MNDRMLLSVREAAELCGYSKTFLYEQLNAGRLPSVRLGRTLRIPRQWLERWIAEQVSKWEAARDEQ